MVQICGRGLSLIEKKQIFLKGHENDAVVILKSHHILCLDQLLKLFCSVEK